eukprot:500679-Alexandrium_andersonii.AAC.1
MLLHDLCCKSLPRSAPAGRMAPVWRQRSAGRSDRIGAGAYGHRKMQNGIRRSKLELRGSRKDLRLGFLSCPRL